MRQVSFTRARRLLGYCLAVAAFGFALLPTVTDASASRLPAFGDPVRLGVTNYAHRRHHEPLARAAEQSNPCSKVTGATGSFAAEYSGKLYTGEQETDAEQPAITVTRFSAGAHGSISASVTLSYAGASQSFDVSGSMPSSDGTGPIKVTGTFTATFSWHTYASLDGGLDSWDCYPNDTCELYLELYEGRAVGNQSDRRAASNRTCLYGNYVISDPKPNPEVEGHGAVGDSGEIWMISAGAPATAVWAQPTTCRNVIVIGARGSGQSGAPDDDRALGPEINLFASALESKLQQRGLTVEVGAVRYPADDVAGDLVPSRREIALLHEVYVNIALTKGRSAAVKAAYDVYYRANVAKYLASISDGIKLTVADVKRRAQECPSAVLVLAGYSQGAMVVHRAEVYLANHDAALLDRIGGTLLLADGDRPAHSNAALQLGRAPDRDEGLRPALYQWRKVEVPRPENPPIPSTTVEVCEKGDLVCDFGEPCQSLDASCGEVLIKRLRHAQSGYEVHTGYMSRASLLLNAAAWVGKLVRPAAAASASSLRRGGEFRANGLTS